MLTLWHLILIVSALTTHVSAFGHGIRVHSRMSNSNIMLVMSSSANNNNNYLANDDQGKKTLVVISPPGGVGEVTAVKAATMGASVQWFVVNEPNNQQTPTTALKVTLSPQTLKDIEMAVGNIQLAGAEASSLLLGSGNVVDNEEKTSSSSAIAAIRQWCTNANGLVCCTDGVVDQQQKAVQQAKMDQGQEDPTQIWRNAIKVAAREAAQSIRGMKLAILPANDREETTNTATTNDNDSAGGGIGNILKSVVAGRNKVDVPTSLSAAMSTTGGGKQEGDGSVVKLRHGELFGIPESSPTFSALVGGPRKDAVLCEEYTMRSVRMDPSLSVSGKAAIGTRSSRHAVGEAAALIATGQIPVTNNNLDVCISSQVGIDPIDTETWEAEIKRVEDMLKSGRGAQLFTTSFSSVPDVERLADWLATKWAPAVLRTYDIAAIRVGARPVYASRTGKEGQVEVVWQQLDDFQAVTAGKMLIQVSNDGIVATRAAGDASKGYGSISRQPLPGESVLVRRLVEASSQAIEKGLAKKPVAAKKKPKPEKKKVQEPVVVTSVQSSGTVETEVAAATATATSSTSSSTGPRTAGARRSSERARGSQKKKKTRKPQQEQQQEAPAPTTNSNPSDESKSSWQ